MAQEILLDIEFDGDMNALIDKIREGRAFTYNARPLPIPGAFSQGNKVMANLPHRMIVINLQGAQDALKQCDTVHLNLRFSR